METEKSNINVSGRSQIGQVALNETGDLNLVTLESLFMFHFTSAKLWKVFLLLLQMLSNAKLFPFLFIIPVPPSQKVIIIQ